MDYLAQKKFKITPPPLKKSENRAPQGTFSTDVHPPPSLWAIEGVFVASLQGKKVDFSGLEHAISDDPIRDSSYPSPPSPMRKSSFGAGIRGGGKSDPRTPKNPLFALKARYKHPLYSPQLPWGVYIGGKSALWRGIFALF